MQAAQATQATGGTRFTYTHIAIMALNLSLVVNSLTAITTLAITGDLPWQQHSTVPALSNAAPQYVELKEARQDAIELQMGQLNRPVSTRPTSPNGLQRFVELKEARQEALELRMGQLYSPTPFQEAP